MWINAGCAYKISKLAVSRLAHPSIRLCTSVRLAHFTCTYLCGRAIAGILLINKCLITDSQFLSLHFFVILDEFAYMYINAVALPQGDGPRRLAKQLLHRHLMVCTYYMLNL